MRKLKQEEIKVPWKKKTINKLSFHASTSFFLSSPNILKTKLIGKTNQQGFVCTVSLNFLYHFAQWVVKMETNFGKKKKSSASEYYHNLLIYLRIFPCCPPWQYIFYPKSINPCPNKLFSFMESTDIYIKNCEKKTMHDTSIGNGK